MFTIRSNHATIKLNMGVRVMSFAEYFPIFDKLTPAEQEELSRAAYKRTAPAGTLLHNGSDMCLGLLVIRSGQLRAFITSEEGREVTMYRLFDRDVCLLTASCVLNDIQFDITITAEKETEFWIIPPPVYKAMTERSVVMANYTNQIMAAHFTEVMWLMEQIMWKSMDKRLAKFLLDESSLEGTPKLTITHEKIANHLGTAREVVTRMLRYFQNEGMVKLTRGGIEILNEEKLIELDT